MEMERFKSCAGEEDLGAEALVSGVGQGFRARQPPCGVGLGDALQLLKGDLASAMRVFRALEASAV